MNEDVWFEAVETLLNAKGVDLDDQNAGWQFMFENGWSPAHAVNEMLNND